MIVRSNPPADAELDHAELAWFDSDAPTNEEAIREIGLVLDRFAEELLRVCRKKTPPPPDGAGIAAADAWERFLDVVTSPIEFLGSSELHERAWQLAFAARLTTHDALYVALA